MILIRYLLLGLIVYLLVRAFFRYSEGNTPSSPPGNGNNGKASGKKVSKKVGEYIDYEEVKK